MNFNDLFRFLIFLLFRIRVGFASIKNASETFVAE